MQTSELIERLKQATGADRELDAAIALGLGWLQCGTHTWWNAEQVAEARRKKRSKWSTGYPRELPAFTASIDAALTLADSETDPLDLLEEALASCRDERDGVYYLPLHISIAALRARNEGEA